MKTIRIFGMVLMTLLLSYGLSACSSDDDDETETSEIVGTWYFDNDVTMTLNEDGTGSVTMHEEDVDDLLADDNVRAKSTVSTSGMVTLPFTWKIDKQTGMLIRVIYIHDKYHTFTWTDVNVDDNTLTGTDEKGKPITGHRNKSNNASGTLLSSISASGMNFFSIQYDSKQRVEKITTFDDYDEESDTYLYVTSYFTYDSAGNLASIKQYDQDYWIYYSDIKLTAEGYLKSFHVAYDNDYGDAKLEYDSEGHLTSVYSDATDGWSSLKLTWKNGCLVSEVATEEDDPDDPDGTTEAYHWTYGDVTNGTEQYTACTAFEGGFSLIGLFGKGPKYLPTSLTSDGDTYALSYTKNASGAVATETMSAYGASITYYYDYLSDTSSSAKMRPQTKGTAQGQLKMPRLPRLFGKRR